MKLSKIAILAIKGLGQDIKDKIAEVTNSKTGTVYGWIARNEPNSSLTLSAVVQIISDETGLTSEQILEEEENKAIVSVA